MKKAVTVLLLVLVLAVFWTLWARYGVTSCFGSIQCTLEQLNITDDVLVIQHSEGEWRIVTYTEGRLTLHRIRLQGSPVPELEDREQSVGTSLGYSPLTFGIESLHGLENVDGIVARFNGSVRAVKIDDIQRNAVPCSELLKVCPSCKLVLGEGGERVRLGRTNLTGGYLVLPSDGCSSTFVLEILPYNTTHDLITARYPMGIVRGYVPGLAASSIGNWNEPQNFSEYLDVGRGVLVTAGAIVVNPDPWGIVEVLGECRIVPRITVHRDGRVEREDYGKPCWEK